MARWRCCMLTCSSSTGKAHVFTHIRAWFLQHTQVRMMDDPIVKTLRGGKKERSKVTPSQSNKLIRMGHERLKKEQIEIWLGVKVIGDSQQDKNIRTLQKETRWFRDQKFPFTHHNMVVEGIDFNTTFQRPHHKPSLEEQHRSRFYKSYEGATINLLSLGMRQGIEWKSGDDLPTLGKKKIRGWRLWWSRSFTITFLILILEVKAAAIEIRCRREACVCLFTSELWREDAAHFMSGETESSSVV